MFDFVLLWNCVGDHNCLEVGIIDPRMAGPEKIPWVKMAYTLVAPADTNLREDRDTRAITQTGGNMEAWGPTNQQDNHECAFVWVWKRSCIMRVLTCQPRDILSHTCLPCHRLKSPLGPSHPQPAPYDQPHWPSSAPYGLRQSPHSVGLRWMSL